MIVIIDNGSQYTHLIKRNCRDLGFEATILNNKKRSSEFKNIIKNAEKIILSGGPSSVTAGNNGLSEEIVKKVINGVLPVPLLGICFGHQLLAHMFNGKVEKGDSAEYGTCEIEIDDEDILFKGVPKKLNAWVSHFDTIKLLPENFVGLAHSKTCQYEAIKHKENFIFGVQFHPEVWHTEHGEKILANFLKI
ncbi:MAG TPA: glutamine-hydrolyzing GMP synthase [Candidatus Bilamarchaeaceae archaeon]|nr:glutamine-hydrolyzing GMP synthase [Candidatus Bilamarchaeaceae archaeon]